MRDERRQDHSYFKFSNNARLTTAPSPITAAAMPSPTSNLLALRTVTAGACRSAGPGEEGNGPGLLTAEPVLVGGRAAGAGAAAVGGRGGGGGGAPAADGAGPLTVAPPGEDAGAPPGNVGNLMVGEDAGLGGRLIRTVSFLGWTLAASPGLGGTAPPGTLGLVSAIIVNC